MPVKFNFSDSTDRQEGVSSGCRRTHPDGTVDEAWIITGPKTTSTVTEMNQATLGMLLESAFAAGRRSAP